MNIDMNTELINEQKEAFDKYINKKNIFITGPGGTGKTYLIKKIVSHAKSNFRQYKVCALTGCAAILLECNATTLHAFSGIGLASGNINDIVNKVVNSWPKRSKWSKLDLLIVDEVSMLSFKLFVILDKIARIIKRKPLIPFGGIQLVFSGDFYQLPPVGDENDPESCQFCFESPLWKEIFPQPIVLKTIYRQTDSKYIKLLNNIRLGKLTKKSYEYLKACIHKKYTDEIYPTMILPRRYDVDFINNKEFNKLEGEAITYNITNVPIGELPLSTKDRGRLSLINKSDMLREI